MNTEPARLAALDHAHVWHPFTPMRRWRSQAPLIIERADRFHLVDTEGHRYIDGVSSLWCNVHGHRVPEIDQAIRDQLERVAHTTLLGLASPPSIELAQRLSAITPGPANKVFYSDAGATALEVAFKMAVGYWHHRGHPQRRRFIGMAGAYHGDTTGSMSVGFCDLFHRPFVSMVFEVARFAHPDPCRPPDALRRTIPPGLWPSEHRPLHDELGRHCLAQLEALLQHQGHETAAIVIEPVMQGAAGMICQPPGFVREVAQLARAYGVLLIADEVATGFGRTGKMFAVEHDLTREDDAPDILCLAKGLSGGYLPLAATCCRDEIEQAFCDDATRPDPTTTLFHGHTYTGNALGCAAALASLDLFATTNLLEHIAGSAHLIQEKLEPLRDVNRFPQVLDVRQRGIMVGVELCADRRTGRPLDPAQGTAAQLCQFMRRQGLILRPLRDVLVLMPIPAMDHATLEQMLDIVVSALDEM